MAEAELGVTERVLAEAAPALGDAGVPRAEADPAGPALAPVAVIGLGHVGLALAVDFLAGGRPVIGFEIDPERAAAIAAGRSPYPHLDGRQWEPRRDAAGREVRLEVLGGRESADWSAVARCAGVVLCLPTPLGADGEPDLSVLEAVAEALAAVLVPGQVVVVASTVWPGATRQVLLPRLARCGLELGREWFLASSPEREDPGRVLPPSRQVPRLVGGVDGPSTAAALEFLRSASDALVPVATAEVAELAKMHENLFRAVNVALVGELKQIAAALGVDVWQVLDAAATKPYGYMGFEPGPGLGGHCLPIDPHYLAFAARRVGAKARFVELAAELGRELPLWIAERIASALAERGTALAGSRVLLLGVAYKAGVADLRESPALALWDELERRGASVGYVDPLVPSLVRGGLVHRSQPESESLLAAQAAVVLLAPQPGLDLELVARAAPLLVDTRGHLRALCQGRANYLPA
ncbi:MAG: nucleotide sugar dehydrogenase [Planctomycetaceae bacterium]|nr:nucleotide sugar dehydrogenase [Planctomycetaceae bacterium]